MLVLACWSCSNPSPLGDQADRDLRRLVIDAAAREVVEAGREDKAVVLSRESGVEGLKLWPGILEELDKSSGPKSYEGANANFGENLLGNKAETVAISLEHAIKASVENNIAVRFARIGPGIGEAQVVAAEAAFDWTFTANLSATRTDSPRVATSFSSNTQGVPSTTEQTGLTTSVGLRRNLVGGGRLTLQHGLDYTDDSTPLQTSRPNPANLLSFTVQYDQPLLRGLGSEVSLADVRVARNAERNSVQTLRRDLGQVVSDVERTYWQLTLAHKDLLILQRLLERGERVRDQLIARRGESTTAQLADARAKIERRKADIIRAQTQLRIVSDRLKQLINDPAVPVGSEIILAPTDRPVDEPVRFSLPDSVLAAVQFRPEVQQAVLAIDDSSIRAIVAENARLPDLSLRLQAKLSSLDDSSYDAYGQAIEGRFFDALFALVFELPIGNRKAEGDYRRRVLERMQSVIAYRNTVQQVTQEVKSALDRLVLNYKLIEQTRTSRIAAAEVLRVLLIEKENAPNITPERLDLEFSRQEALAQAEREESQALAEYNSALTDLYAAMGTNLERNRINFVVPTADER